MKTRKPTADMTSATVEDLRKEVERTMQDGMRPIVVTVNQIRMLIEEAKKRR